MSGRLVWCVPLLAAAAALGQRPEFVKIPAGSFMMGCVPEDGCSEVLPLRRVEFNRSFWIGKTEVTVRQFQAFVKATGYRTDAKSWGCPHLEETGLSRFRPSARGVYDAQRRRGIL